MLLFLWMNHWLFHLLILVKRQYSKLNLELTRKEVEGVSKEDLEHFIESLLQNINACIHVYVQYGENDHHKIEAAMKAFAVAFRMAAKIDSKQTDIPIDKRCNVDNE